MASDLKAARDTANISFNTRIPGRDRTGSHMGAGTGLLTLAWVPGSTYLRIEECGINQEKGRKGLVKAHRGRLKQMFLGC